MCNFYLLTNFETNLSVDSYQSMLLTINEVQYRENLILITFYVTY